MIGRLRNLAWDGRYLLRRVFDAVRWPFERALWAVERWAVWPLRERSTGLSTPARAVALGSLGVLVAGALAFGLTRGGDGESAPVAVAPVSAPVAKSKPKPVPEPPDQTLRGAAPDFTPEDGDTAAGKTAKADTVVSSEPGGGGPPQSSTSTPSSSAFSASSSATKPKKVADPGPAAIDVARRFSAAFVRYETGKTDPQVRRAFRATATPRLTKALLRRPPRLPANVDVPKAKVLNVVPGPRQGNTFTLSASLLRVGVTSELRIDVQREDRSGEWQVTDVLG